MRVRLALLAALIAGPALAAGTDAPVAAAPASAPTPSTAEQIDTFIKTSPARELRPDEAVDGVVSTTDRQPHGEIGVGVGTNGYRSVYARTEMPLGANGRLALAFEDSRLDGVGRGRGAYGRGFGASLSFASPDRQRCDVEAMTPSRPLDRLGGPHGRCGAPPSDW